MQGHTDTEMRGIFAGYENLRCEGRRLSFVGSEAKTIVIDLHVKEPHQLVYLARLVALLGWDDTPFAGAYLWVTTWGVWNSQEEAIGFKTLEQFRRSYGENRSLESAPGLYFRHNEFAESVCCLLQPMLVGWDAYYVHYTRTILSPSATIVSSISKPERTDVPQSRRHLEESRVDQGPAESRQMRANSGRSSVGLQYKIIQDILMVLWLLPKRLSASVPAPKR